MKQNTTPTTAEGKATAPRRYIVSDRTAALLDCITAAGDLYAQIVDTLQAYHGAEGIDQYAAPFLQPIEDLTAQLYKELDTRIVDGLMIVKNSHSDSPVL